MFELLPSKTGARLKALVGFPAASGQAAGALSGLRASIV